MQMLYDSDAFVVVHMQANEPAEGEPAPGIARHGFEIVDKGSSNGVRVNAVELKRSIIEAGDVIELGDVRFKFVGAGQVFVPGPNESQQLTAISDRDAELADARNMAESLAYQTERTLKEHRDKLDESDASTIEGRIMELKGVLESQDPSEIRQKTEELQEASQKLAEAIYAQATAQQAASPSDGNDGGPDDEVVEEADYEVIDEEEAKTS